MTSDHDTEAPGSAGGTQSSGSAQSGIPSTHGQPPSEQRADGASVLSDQERVDEASWESFPASDSPGWTPVAGTGRPYDHPVATPSHRRPRVVIIGGGFGGLAAAKALKDEPVDVTLIDRRNHHLFQPLLYQVATGALSPANIAVPLRRILSKQANVRVLLADVEDVNLEGHAVRLDGRGLAYDYLVIAAGSTNHWFGHDEWREHAPGLKSVREATQLRSQILKAFEEAELRAESLQPDPGRLTFVIVGAGPTGVEMAGAISELARDTLRHDFREIDPTSAHVVLLEAAPQVLPSYPERLAKKAQGALEKLGVDVRTGAFVTDVDEGGVTFKGADGRTERLESCTVIWAAGVQAESLAGRLAAAAGIEPDRGGRIPVGRDLSLADHPEVFVIGDMAAVTGRDGKTLPGLAPVAIQEGEHAARAILARMRRTAPASFEYRDSGAMATVGRGYAVLKRGRLQLSGLAGWLGWLFVHLVQVTEFENRLLVLTQWAWSYLTRNRSARLIVQREDPGAPPPAKAVTDTSAVMDPSAVTDASAVTEARGAPTRR